MKVMLNVKESVCQSVSRLMQLGSQCWKHHQRLLLALSKEESALCWWWYWTTLQHLHSFMQPDVETGGPVLTSEVAVSRSSKHRKDFASPISNSFRKLLAWGDSWPELFIRSSGGFYYDKLTLKSHFEHSVKSSGKKRQRILIKKHAKVLRKWNLVGEHNCIKFSIGSEVLHLFNATKPPRDKRLKKQSQQELHCDKLLLPHKSLLWVQQMKLK